MKSIFNKIVRTAISIAGNGLSQKQNQWNDEQYVVPENAKKLIRTLASEGIVLLKNDGVLPLENKTKVAVFGRCQINYFYCGYGSGGDVNSPYKVNLIDALKCNDNVVIDSVVEDFYRKWVDKNPPDDGFWGHWPMCYEEPVLSNELIESAVKNNDTAIVIIGRATGEDRENVLKKGSYYLNDKEKLLIKNACDNFNKIIVIYDCGNIIDFNVLEEFGDKISAVVCAFQGGMESGNALADVLTGVTNPSGRLTDTIARNYTDYPSSKNFGNKMYNNYGEDIFVGYRYFETFAKDCVLYPFGYGLSYTDFNNEVIDFNISDNTVYVKVRVTNIGKRAGKQVLELYCEQPKESFSVAERILCAFEKSDIISPQASQILELSVPLYYVSSFDDNGISGYDSSYITVKGDYKFFVSESVRGGIYVGKYECREVVCLTQHEHICPAKTSFERLTSNGGKLSSDKVNACDVDLKSRILKNLPKSFPIGANNGYTLDDVKLGKISIEEFVSELTVEDLQSLSHGDFTMNSKLGPDGNGGAFGGITESLQSKGIPPLITTDGPAGIRLKSKQSLLPTGVCTASSWNTALIESVYAFIGSEMLKCGSDILLGPGMNIHRDPLCGRNFEYFSEDPIVSGKCAAAFINGIQSVGLSACPKHFACNNQETNRVRNDTRISERALREIYLKGFEIAVKEAKPNCIMTSYNKINSVYSYHNYDLVTTLLRNEWNYDGMVMTDWWTKSGKSPDFPLIRDNSYRVRAQVDVLMPGADSRFPFAKKKSNKTLLESLGKPDGITLGEIQRTAINVLKLCLKYNEK